MGSYENLKAAITELEECEQTQRDANRAYCDYEVHPGGKTIHTDEARRRQLTKSALDRAHRRAVAAAKQARTHVIEQFRMAFQVTVEERGDE